MTPRIKVRNGTPNSDGSLCFSCRNAIRIKTTHGGEYLRCGVLGEFLKKRIANCSEYEDKGKPSVYELKQIAWMLETDKVRGPVGFAPPKKQRDIEDIISGD